MKKYYLSVVLGVFAILMVQVRAEAGKEVTIPMEVPTFCDHWKSAFGTNPVYEGDGIINEVRWLMRYHGQYYNVESDGGDDSDWENRRWRFGTKIQFLEDFTFTGRFNLKRDFDKAGRFVDNVEDLTIEYDPDGAGWDLTIGKQKARLTREWNTSANKIKTMERSILANNIVPNKIGGAILGLDEVGALKDVKLGVFSGSVDDDWAYPTFEGGFGANFSAGYELTDNTDIGLDYLYTDNDENADSFEGFEHAFSLNTITDFSDRLKMENEVIYGVAHGGGSDLFGVVLMPYYSINDNLEFVFRYTYANADQSGGLNVQSRYERRAAGRLRGDEYHAFYLGLNYYICGDRLKLMSGVEFSELDGLDENSYTSYWSGVRLYF